MQLYQGLQLHEQTFQLLGVDQVMSAEDAIKYAYSQAHPAWAALVKEIERLRGNERDKSQT